MRSVSRPAPPRRATKDRAKIRPMGWHLPFFAPFAPAVALK
jgi:hypothetical protein